MHAELNEWGSRLSALRDFDPPSRGWIGVLAAREARDARIGMALPAVLAVAVLALAVGLAYWLQSAQRELSAVPDAAALRWEAVAADVRAENERLERILAGLPERSALHGSTAFTLAELEDRLALLDDRLSRVVLEPNAPERAEGLWRERVEVMHTLVQVRYADAMGSY